MRQLQHYNELRIWDSCWNEYQYFYNILSKLSFLSRISRQLQKYRNIQPKYMYTVVYTRDFTSGIHIRYLRCFYTLHPCNDFFESLACQTAAIYRFDELRAALLNKVEINDVLYITISHTAISVSK